MYRIRWPDQEGTEYHLSHGDWVRLEDLIEPPATPDAQQHEFYDYVTPEWASKWPAEEIWVARLR
jgi:hypothetical protein